MKAPFVQLITLAAGAVSPVYNYEFDFMHIRPQDSATYTDEISAKFDGGAFEKVATGFGFGSPGEVSRQIQFKNTGVSAVTFTVTLFRGNVFSNNMNFDGTATIGQVVVDTSGGAVKVNDESLNAGLPSTRTTISATTGGVTAAIGTSAKQAIFYADVYPVEIYNAAGTYRIGRVGVGDMVMLPIKNITLTLKGIGGTSTVNITEII